MRGPLQKTIVPGPRNIYIELKKNINELKKILNLFLGKMQAPTVHSYKKNEALKNFLISRLEVFKP